MAKAMDLPLNQSLKFFRNESFHSKLRQSETEEELEAFEWFFGDFMECVCGKRIWGIQKYQELISKARDKETGGIIVTISDEAFGLLLIDNYRAKWISKVEAARIASSSTDLRAAIADECAPFEIRTAATAGG